MTTTLAKKKNGHSDYAYNQNTVLITQYHEIGTVVRPAATSRIAALKRNQAWFLDIPR